MSKSKKHQRHCPALGRDISAAECGSGRGSSYACPADCPFFPFTPANYEQHGEIESRLIQKTYERAARLMTSAERERMLRVLDGEPEGGDEVLANHARFAWRCHWQRDAEGSTFGERWLAEKAGGLSNDERVLLAGVKRVRPILLEVHRILDEQTIEGVDLLDGSALRIIDRATAKAVVRYSAMLLWSYPMAHYERTSGGGLFIPDVQEMEPLEILREIIRHLGGPAALAGERAWLAEHFARTCAALGAMQLARWQATMSALDARYTKTDYRITGTRLSSAIAKLPELIEEPLAGDERAQGFEKGFVWLAAAPAIEPEQPALPLPGEPQVAHGTGVLGRVLIGRERVRIEAMSQARHRELRTRFERLAAGKVEFIGERTDDLGTQTLGRDVPAFDPALVPPRLMENPQRISLASQRLPAAEGGLEATLLETFRRQYAAFIDESIPWLGGRTPRAAAADPALRPRLVSLMKTHIRNCDRQRRTEGLDLDLNPLLAELGLHELISEPPPVGIADDERDDDELDEEAAAAFDELGALGRGGKPHAVMPPLSEREVDRRMRAELKKYPDPDSAADALDIEFPGLLDFAWEATRSTLDERAWPFLEVLIVRACQVMKPPAGPAPRLDFERLVRGFAGEFARLSKLMLGSDKRKETDTDRWIMESPQPVVMQDLTNTLLNGSGKVRRKDRPNEESLLLILAFLKTLLAEFSRVLA